MSDNVLRHPQQTGNGIHCNIFGGYQGTACGWTERNRMVPSNSAGLVIHNNMALQLPTVDKVDCTSIDQEQYWLLVLEYLVLEYLMITRISKLIITQHSWWVSGTDKAAMVWFHLLFGNEFVFRFKVR